MVGNDIVDLKFAKTESNWKRPRFLEKIFTKKERAYILRSEDPTFAVWLLWSMKESVYKIVSRKENRRFFSPKKFMCDYKGAQRHKDTKGNGLILGDFVSLCLKKGTVTYQDQTFQTQTQLTPDYIHTTAHYPISHLSLFSRFTDNNSSYFSHNVFHLPQTNHQSQSQCTRTQLLTFYAQKTSFPVENLSIQKNSAGIPYIYFQNQPQPVVISLSHHGNYGGFAIHLDHD